MKHAFALIGCCAVVHYLSTFSYFGQVVSFTCCYVGFPFLRSVENPQVGMVCVGPSKFQGNKSLAEVFQVLQGDHPMSAVDGATKRAALMADMGADHSHVPAEERRDKVFISYYAVQFRIVVAPTSAL